MDFFKKPVGKIVLGIVLIIIGIVAKRAFNLGAPTMIFHLAAAVFLALGLIQIVTKK